MLVYNEQKIARYSPDPLVGWAGNTPPHTPSCLRRLTLLTIAD